MMDSETYETRLAKNWDKTVSGIQLILVKALVEVDSLSQGSSPELHGFGLLTKKLRTYYETMAQTKSFSGTNWDDLYRSTVFSMIGDRHHLTAGQLAPELGNLVANAERIQILPKPEIEKMGSFLVRLTRQYLISRAPKNYYFA